MSTPKTPKTVTIGLRPGLYRETVWGPFVVPTLIPTPPDTWEALQAALAYVQAYGAPPPDAPISFGPDTRTDVDRVRMFRSGWARMSDGGIHFPEVLSKISRLLMDHPMADLYRVYRWHDRVARWCWRGVAAVLNWRRPHGRARAFLPRLGHVQFPEGR